VQAFQVTAEEMTEFFATAPPFATDAEDAKTLNAVLAKRSPEPAPKVVKADGAPWVDPGTGSPEPAAKLARLQVWLDGELVQQLAIDTESTRFTPAIGGGGGMFHIKLRSNVERSPEPEQAVASDIAAKLETITAERDKYAGQLQECAELLGVPLREAADARHMFSPRSFYERCTSTHNELCAQLEAANKRAERAEVQLQALREACDWNQVSRYSWEGRVEALEGEGRLDTAAYIRRIQAALNALQQPAECAHDWQDTGGAASEHSVETFQRCTKCRAEQTIETPRERVGEDDEARLPTNAELEEHMERYSKQPRAAGEKVFALTGGEVRTLIACWPQQPAEVDVVAWAAKLAAESVALGDIETQAMAQQPAEVARPDLGQGEPGYMRLLGVDIAPTEGNGYKANMPGGASCSGPLESVIANVVEWMTGFRDHNEGLLSMRGVEHAVDVLSMRTGNVAPANELTVTWPNQREPREQPAEVAKPEAPASQRELAARVDKHEQALRMVARSLDVRHWDDVSSLGVLNALGGEVAVETLSREQAYALVEADLRAIPHFDHLVLAEERWRAVAIEEDETTSGSAGALLEAVDALKNSPALYAEDGVGK
jgi:hypothetical protein